MLIATAIHLKMDKRITIKPEELKHYALLQEFLQTNYIIPLMDLSNSLPDCFIKTEINLFLKQCEQENDNYQRINKMDFLSDSKIKPLVDWIKQIQRIVGVNSNINPLLIEMNDFNDLNNQDNINKWLMGCLRQQIKLNLEQELGTSEFNKYHFEFLNQKEQQIQKCLTQNDYNGVKKGLNVKF